MSQTPSTASSSSNFHAIFCASLETYKMRTKKDLLAHPLMFEQSTSGDDKLTKWLIPTVNVLYAFSAVLGEGVGLVNPIPAVFSPAKVIFAGAGVLLLAAKDVVASQDVLVDIFERIESFFIQLEEYAAVPTTEAMRDIIVKIMVEVLEIFGIVTKGMKEGRAKKYLKKLIGRRDIEDALGRLDRLTQQEMLKVAHQVKDGVTTIGEQVQGVDDKVKGVDDKVKDVDDKVKDVNDNIKGVDDRSTRCRRQAQRGH
ncbi:hypothetical protein EDB87DRAFT_1824598 [Lactarius vividus]|nr:hypothetical protein EDB87DRAFT_1824598 [Lactarius vividus]